MQNSKENTENHKKFLGAMVSLTGFLVATIILAFIFRKKIAIACTTIEESTKYVKITRLFIFNFFLKSINEYFIIALLELPCSFLRFF